MSTGMHFSSFTNCSIVSWSSFILIVQCISLYFNRIGIEPTICCWYSHIAGIRSPASSSIFSSLFHLLFCSSGHFYLHGLSVFSVIWKCPEIDLENKTHYVKTSCGWAGLAQVGAMSTWKLRRATYTAAVCNFRGGHFLFWFISECGTARQLSLLWFDLI